MALTGLYCVYCKAHVQEDATICPNCHAPFGKQEQLVATSLVLCKEASQQYKHKPDQTPSNLY
jgi:predicted amidophosphoribosyltransferase